MSNVDYWREYAGETYRLQQGRRRSHNRSYAEQEQWLLDYFTKYVATSAKQHCTLLDFGCGFGRIARLLSGIDGIDYFGFDISPKMVERQDNSPPALTDLSDRVRVGENLEDVFPQGKFDVILTVSVLIHNPPAQVRSILATMFKYLKPGGRIVLIENPHTAVSTIENFWHGGCWCHSFARDLDGLADVEIFDNFAARHAIYIATRRDERQESRFIYHADQHARGETIQREALLLRGLQRASINADHLTAEAAGFSDDRPGLIAQIHDLSERLSEKEREISLSKARFHERQKLLEDLAIVSNEARRRHAPVTNSDALQTVDSEPTKQVQWNARRDCAYSQALPEFARTLSVFHQEWFGIRAALGSFGGGKLAISTDTDLQKEHVLQIYKRIVSEGFTHIVFHGLSPNACRLLSFLSKRGLGEHLYVVIHGAAAQWIDDNERRMAFRALEYLRSGQIRKLHFMRTGFRFPLEGLFRPVLFNFSPNISDRRPSHSVGTARPECVALSAGWGGLRKNVYTNVMGAALSDRVEAIWLYAPNIELAPPLSKKLRPQRYVSRETTFQLMAASSLCLNVSLVDCHPMVNVESQTFGRPCLRGPLFLDALEDHPYVKATTVYDVNSPAEIRDRIDSLCSIPAAEREQMTLDYQKRSDEVARARYREFLEL